MNIAQIKTVAWALAAVLTLGLSTYVYDFVAHHKQRHAMPDAEHVRAVLEGVGPVKMRTEDVLPYETVRRLFDAMNWTGRKIVAQQPVADDSGPKTPAATPVAELVRVGMVRTDLADPKGSAVWLRYRPRSGVTVQGLGGGVLLREGERLAAPHQYARIAAIRPEGVWFGFDDEGRETELVLPEEFEARTRVVVVGPDGAILPPRRSGIPRLEGDVFRPGRTTPLGANRYVMGSEDLTFAADNYSQILSEMRTRQHRDPRTGRYAGVEITQVVPGSYAQRHGAQEGDVVKSINGHAVNSVQEAVHFVKTNSGRYTTWEIVIENKGKTRTVTYDSPNQ